MEVLQCWFLAIDMVARSWWRIWMTIFWLLSRISQMSTLLVRVIVSANFVCVFYTALLFASFFLACRYCFHFFFFIYSLIAVELLWSPSNFWNSPSHFCMLLKLQLEILHDQTPRYLLAVSVINDLLVMSIRRNWFEYSRHNFVFAFVFWVLFWENASLCLSFGCFMIKIGTILLSTGLHDKHIKVLNICFNINLGPAANGRNH